MKTILEDCWDFFLFLRNLFLAEENTNDSFDKSISFIKDISGRTINIEIVKSNYDTLYLSIVARFGKKNINLSITESPTAKRIWIDMLVNFGKRSPYYCATTIDVPTLDIDRKFLSKVDRFFQHPAVYAEIHSILADLKLEFL